MIIQRRIQATGRVFNTHCKGFSFFGRCRQQGRPVEAMQGRERTKTPWHTNKSKTDDEFIFIYMKKDLDCTVPSQILDVIYIHTFNKNLFVVSLFKSLCQMKSIGLDVLHQTVLILILDVDIMNSFSSLPFQ